MNGFRLSDYDYPLPAERVAQIPTARREDSRLMCVDVRSGAITHHVFSDLPAVVVGRFPDQKIGVVANRSKVIGARFLGRETAHGTPLEIFLVEKIEGLTWEVMIRHKNPKKIMNGIRWESGDALEQTPVLSAVVSRGETPQSLWKATFSHDPMARGDLPLPPYIERRPELSDQDRYQTVYAQEPGSVAAPTAGLHFSEPIRSRMSLSPFEWREVVLHVGPGTFKPIRSDDIREHRMHSERFEIPDETEAALERWKRERRKVLCVGTTSLRVLESRARGMRERTDLFLFPGMEMSSADILLTNFHWPRSSLLVLVSAWAGTDLIREAYRKALENDYRFASYGDAMCLMRS